MFSSSSNGMSPFSQLSPYLNWNPSTSSSSLNNHENLSLLSNQEDLLSQYYISNSIPIIDTSSNNTPQITSNCRTRKQKTKKTDRHSKILTAQGPRDRRVRLSIDISKKFFGLQDLLGFDKASLTLDWLFNKSKASITDLLRTNNKDACLCSLSEEAGDNAAASKETTSTSSKRKRKSCRANSRKPQIMNALDKVAKESRERARQRARERTKVKISLRNILGALPEPKLPDLTSLYSPTSICHWPGQIGSGKSTDSSRQSTLTSSNEHTTDPVEGFFFVNPRTGEVNAHHLDRLFSESARIKTKNKLDFNLWSYSVMNHDL